MSDASSGCIFCKIVSGAVPAKVVHRDADAIAIADLNPQAPTHLLVMPVRHAANLEEFARTAPPDAAGRLFELAATLGRREGAEGFRLVVNTGANGGQTVDHLHVHVLAGRAMQWPPG
jgi:histidine triad (HIT) family protein